MLRGEYCAARKSCDRLWSVLERQEVCLKPGKLPACLKIDAFNIPVTELLKTILDGLVETVEPLEQAGVFRNTRHLAFDPDDGLEFGMSGARFVSKAF